MPISKFKFGCFSGDVTVINFCNSWKRRNMPIKKPQQHKKHFQWTIGSLYLKNDNFCLEVFDVCFYVIIIAKQSFLHGYGWI